VRSEGERRGRDDDELGVVADEVVDSGVPSTGDDVDGALVKLPLLFK
jgi:hypothetical protein